MTEKQRRRFMEKVIPEPMSGCWLWVAGANARGYGSVNCGGASHLAHRLSWRMHRGEIPDGLSVCHRCDNPSCVNPDHLFLGTHAENMADRNRKGRVASGPRSGAWKSTWKRCAGERHPKAKLTEDAVREIRASTDPERALAARYGVSKATISNVRLNKGWAHVA